MRLETAKWGIGHGALNRTWARGIGVSFVSFYPQALELDLLDSTSFTSGTGFFLRPTICKYITRWEFVLSSELGLSPWRYQNLSDHFGLLVSPVSSSHSSWYIHSSPVSENHVSVTPSSIFVINGGTKREFVWTWHGAAFKTVTEKFKLAGLACTIYPICQSLPN